MIPQDPLTKRNEAIDLWNAKAIDPVTFFERLDFPDPEEAARKMLQYQLDPASAFAELGGVPPMMPGQPAPEGVVPMQLPPPQQVNPGALPPL